MFPGIQDKKNLEFAYVPLLRPSLNQSVKI